MPIYKRVFKQMPIYKRVETAGETAGGTMTMFSLDLRQFDGDGAGSGEDSGYAQAETAENVNEVSADDQPATDTSEDGKPEDLEKEFDQLIKGKYKAQFDARQQKAISSRFKSLESERAEAQKANQLKDAVSMRYGLQNASTDEIIAAINGDESFLEEAAAREGLSPEQFRKMADLQQRVAAADRAAEEAKKAEIKSQIDAKLRQQTEECRQMFPDFDFDSEAQSNETFRTMVMNGVDITQAYKFSHMDELLADGMAKAAHRGAQATAAAVRSNLSRPAEAGARNVAAATVGIDFSSMSSEEFNRYQEKLMSGE